MTAQERQAIGDAMANRQRMAQEIPLDATCRDCGRTWADHDWQGGCPDDERERCRACGRFVDEESKHCEVHE